MLFQPQPLPAQPRPEPGKTTNHKTTRAEEDYHDSLNLQLFFTELLLVFQNQRNRTKPKRQNKEQRHPRNSLELDP
jgi:hypothetical protein